MIFRHGDNVHRRFGSPNSRPIIYIDESGFAKDSPRTHGYSYQGERCYGSHDWNARGRTNVIGAITKSEFLTSVLISENINSEIFYQWLVDDLLKIAPKNSVIVLDIATFHRRAFIRETIEKAGHKLLYLPSYSPHLNPIEKKWAYLKHMKRKHQASVEYVFNYFI